MGHLHWGNLYKIRGIVYYRLSPYELNPFAGLISKGLPNLIRRAQESLPNVIPHFVVGYLIYDWNKKEHHRLSRKNPKDFENDV